MDDLCLTNEHLKDHLITLSMDKKLVERMEAISTTTKTSFTKQFNKSHKNNTTAVKKTVGKKGVKQP